ncbi:MAG: hypothetical protein MJE68_21315 [Proteobacteria bacterium]|nr:hypothetical protein [Pseudomonadota bacterium]
MGGDAEREQKTCKKKRRKIKGEENREEKIKKRGVFPLYSLGDGGGVRAGVVWLAQKKRGCPTKHPPSFGV